ncbi:hypothetical protein ACQ4LE_008845 [Meloidogyne hapla]
MFAPKKNGPVEDNEPLLIEEAYSGEAVHEYMIKDRKSSNITKRPLRQHIHNAWAFFVEVFMPQGYPQTVSSDYLEYQKWDTLQAFASSQNGALATLAVLKGVGVGNEQATVLAAALTWLLKDGVGMIARIVFAWARGSRLDSDNKQWRLIADFLNDFSFMVELFASYLPRLFFAPLACFAAFIRAIVGVSGGTTRMAVIRHQARRDNLADVAAKDGSQETLVNVFSLLCSLILLPTVEGNPLLIWLFYFSFTYVHLYSNYRAAKSLKFDILNQARFFIAVRYFLKYGSAPSIQFCNADEPILVPLLKSYHHLNLGCPLSSLPKNSSVLEFLSKENGEGKNICWKWANGKLLCVVDKMEKIGWMVIVDGATQEDLFNSLFSIEYFGLTKSWPTEEKINQFRESMTTQGWSLHTNQLNIDEWRFSNSNIANGVIKKEN